MRHGPGARFTNDFFARNSNSMENSPYCNSIADHQIATNFCTRHDSTDVVPCTKFCSDHCIRIDMKVKRNIHRISIAMEKLLVKWGPALLVFQPTSKILVGMNCIIWATMCMYSISQEICTRFCCALLCCGYVIIHNEFTWCIYPYSPGLLCWHWGNLTATVPVK